MTLEVTNSETQTFRRCKRKWYLIYFRRLGLDDSKFVPTGPMHIGIIIHDALEALYTAGADPVAMVNVMYAFHRQRFVNDPYALDAIEKDRQLAVLMVEGYVQWLTDEGIDEDLELISAEEHVSVPSGIEGVNLLGKLDLRAHVRSSGARVFVDHKTVGDLKSPLVTIEINEQFKHYGLLEKLVRPNDDSYSQGGMINMLRRVKRTVRANPPFYGREIVKHNDTELRNMWTRVHSIIQQMLIARARLDRGADHHEVAYPTPHRDCAWDCHFLQVCAQMEDGSRWEAALDSHYVEIDPNARYHEDTLLQRALAWHDSLEEAS